MPFFANTTGTCTQDSSFTDIAGDYDSRVQTDVSVHYGDTFNGSMYNSIVGGRDKRNIIIIQPTYLHSDASGFRELGDASKSLDDSQRGKNLSRKLLMKWWKCVKKHLRNRAELG
ncbi:hypothetical protein BDQ12DRAFT_668828 [Crucibulum laeve]|uniref:Uncharacterized protein n=1 Tax=Crucibulum laeve TaxID=68775 RepID=A0A5C3LT80_9AGAR|nr:hypothetical protein BDQ12DRAFT_668828 [Crucibulum laeve]